MPSEHWSTLYKLLIPNVRLALQHMLYLGSNAQLLLHLLHTFFPPPAVCYDGTQSTRATKQLD